MDSDTTANLLDIATDGERLVAVGSGRGTYRVSTDGSSWSGDTIGRNHHLYGVEYTGTQFLTVGQDFNSGWARRDLYISRWLGLDAATFRRI